MMNEPWSKKHKRDFGGKPFSLSNSFAQPLSQSELVALCQAHGHVDLLEEYQQSHSLEYTPNGGSLDLKQAIAELYNDDKITAEHILVTPGGQCAIQIAAQALLQRNQQQHAIVFTPGYQSVVESPSWILGDAHVTKIAKSPANDWKLNLPQIQAAIQPGQTNYLILNEPYNPAGVLTMDRPTQQALIELCRQHDIMIVCDEVYRLLEHDPADRLPAICEVYEKGVSIVTMSKPWGACGVTIGWMACRDPSMLEKLWNVQYFGCACPSRASELQAMMVLRNSPTILQERLDIIRHNKALLQKVIEEEYPDLLSWVRPNAGAIGFVQFKGPLNSLELGQLLATKGISIKPAYCFTGTTTTTTDDEEDLASYFRVGFGERKMPAALEAFCAVLDEYKDAWRETMKKN